MYLHIYIYMPKKLLQAQTNKFQKHLQNFWTKIVINLELTFAAYSAFVLLA